MSKLRHGTVLLKGAHAQYQVVWNAADKDRRRFIPAGRYRLWTTRVERRIGKQHWFLSMTGPPSKKSLEVRKGNQLEVRVPHTIRFRGTIRKARGKLQVGFAITSDDKKGLSIYKNGKRVPISFELRDAKGRVLHKGPLRYG